MVSSWCLPQVVEASGERLALLVGNQRGWEKEPILDYVLSGDVQPLAKSLRGLGFHVILQKNQKAATVRKTFERIRRYIKAHPKITTFLFYYSGHADQKYFHLGLKGKNPLSYQDFARFFSSFQVKRKIAIFDSCYSGEIIRRFGSLERYKKLLKKGKAKGIRRSRKVDLHKMIVPQQGHEQGIRIIASSLDLSWEFQEHKASVFTFHMLKGLKGPADQNRDGRITIDELFDYTSQKVSVETGQRPQQLLLLKRSTPYALAPVYRSRLRIGSDVIGTLQVAVAGFVWKQKKTRPYPIRLAVVDGPGTVFWKGKKGCFRQSLRFPKGGEASLTSQWKKVRCQRLARKSKGILQLNAQHYQEDPEDLENAISFGISANFTKTHANVLDSSNYGGGFQVRWWKRWGLGAHFTTTQPENKSFSLTTIWLRPEYGWTWPIHFGGMVLECYASAYLQLGLLVQSGDPTTATNIVGVGGGGMALDFSLWFFRHVGIRLGGQLGLNYTPVKSAATDASSFIYESFSFQWQIRSALIFGF